MQGSWGSREGRSHGDQEAPELSWVVTELPACHLNCYEASFLTTSIYCIHRLTIDYYILCRSKTSDCLVPVLQMEHGCPSFLSFHPCCRLCPGWQCWLPWPTQMMLQHWHFFFFSRSSRSKYGSGFQLLLLAGQTSGISCTVLFPHPPGLHCPLPLAHSPAEHSKMHAFVELQRMYYHKPQLVRDQAQLGIELKWLEIQLSSGSINEQTQTPTNLRFPPFYC